MRTDKERIAALHARADELNKRKREHGVRIIQAVSVVLVIATVVLLAVFMPQAVLPESSSGLPGNMQASIFADRGTLGYVVIAVIAFILGSAVTIFCFRLKKWKDTKAERWEEDPVKEKND